MNKRIGLMVIVLVAALLKASVAVAATEPASPGAMECELDITYDVHVVGEDPFWMGTVVGPDCGVAGVIKFFAVGDEYTYPGNTMHFVEEFTLEPYSGGWIKGKNWGVWNLYTFRYRANGWVKETSDEWQHLEGAKYHESGVTGDPNAGLPIYAPDGWAKLVPAQRQHTP